jgi:DNA-binding GntR family transcriptional regulator
MSAVEREATSEPAAARAYRALERMIVMLELKPSGIVTEGHLIERVGLGRTPVREAIQRLAWEGLVEIRPRSGLAIAPLNPGDWRLVVEARSGVEAVLARSAARRLAPDAAGRLRAAAAAMTLAAEGEDVLAFLVADKELDEVIAGTAGNEFAARVAAPLQTHSRRFWYRYQSGPGLAQSAARHIELIEAILARDEQLAAREAERLMALLCVLADRVTLA